MDRRSATIADGAATITHCPTANHGGATITDCSAGAVTDCSAANHGSATIIDWSAGAVTDRSTADHSSATITDCSAGAVTHYSGTDYGPATIADSSTAAISDCSTANHRATTVGNGPEWRNVTSTVYTASTNKCTRFDTADGEKTSDKAQDYDRISHALSFRAPISLCECLRQKRLRDCNASKGVEIRSMTHLVA
jgi:hypothetical protein